MSGHNKWSQIKRQKEKTDGHKSRVFSKHARVISMESRQAQGNLNSPGLSAAIERAKKDSMPKENIDRAVAKGKDTTNAALHAVTFEAFGPGGTALLISAVTDNNNRTAPEIKHIFTKAGYQIGAPGSAAWAFKKTDEGYLPITPLELNETDGEQLALLIEALEAQDDVQDVYTTADSTELTA